MDIKKKIEELAGRLKEDKDLQARFFKEPIATLEELLGVDLPEEQLKQLAEGVKAKMGLDKAEDLAGDLLGGLFGKNK